MNTKTVQMKQKKIIKRLRADFFGILMLALLLGGLYETGFFIEGEYAGDGQMDFLLNLVGIVLALGMIPMALKLLSFKTVKQRFILVEDKALNSYLFWSEIRLAMLAVSLLLNLSFYYQTLNTSCSGCALITAFAFFFCWPTITKMKGEMSAPQSESKQDNTSNPEKEKGR